MFVAEEGRGHEVTNQLRGRKKRDEVRGVGGVEEGADGRFSSRGGWVRGTGGGEGGENEKCDERGESREAEGTWIALREEELKGREANGIKGVESGGGGPVGFAGEGEDGRRKGGEEGGEFFPKDDVGVSSKDRASSRTSGEDSEGRRGGHALGEVNESVADSLANGRVGSE